MQTSRQKHASPDRTTYGGKKGPQRPNLTSYSGLKHFLLSPLRLRSIRCRHVQSNAGFRFEIRPHSLCLYQPTSAGLQVPRELGRTHVPQSPSIHDGARTQEIRVRDSCVTQQQRRNNNLTGEPKSRRPKEEEEDRWKSTRKIALRPQSRIFLFFPPFPKLPSGQVEAMMRRGIKARAPCRPAVRGRGRPFRGAAAPTATAFGQDQIKACRSSGGLRSA